MAERGNRSSLAGNLMVLLLLVVGVSVTVVSIFALVGVFSLARDEATARQSAYRQAAIDEIAVRLDAALEVMDRVTGIVINPSAQEINEAALGAQFEGSAEYIDRLVVADSDGRVLSGYPARQSLPSLAGEPIFAAAVVEDPQFVFTDDNELWLGRRVEGPGGKLVIAARVRIGWLKTMLDGFASSGRGRWIAISSADGRLAATSSVGPLVAEESLVLEPSSGSEIGHISAVGVDGTVMSGDYAPVGSYLGLDWRVVVAEPRAGVIGSTIRALTPAVIALLVSAGFSLGVGVVFARRLVAPITDLEAHARAAVRGGYVQPIESERTDELGSLADAFDAVALRLNSLRDLSQLLASSSSLEQVLDRILSALSHIVGSTRVAVYLLEEKATVLRLVASQGFDVGHVTVPVEERSWLTDALEAEGPVEFSADSATIRTLGLAPGSVLMGLAAPLKVGQEPVGVVAVFETDRRFFTEAEHEMVKTFSEQAAVAVRNSRLFEIETEARREAETLRVAAEALVRPISLEEAVSEVVAIAAGILDVAWAGYAVIDRMDLGLPPAEDLLAERTLLQVWGRGIVEGRAPDTFVLKSGDDPAVDSFLDEHGGNEILLATAMRGGRPGAVIAFVSAGRARKFSDGDRALAEGFATQVSLALDNAYNYERARGRAANLETIFRISQAVSSSLQIKVVLNRVLDVVQKIFSADAVSLMTIEEGGRKVRTAMARGLVSQELVRFECEPGGDVPGWVFSTGKPVRIDDLESTIGEFARVASDQGLHSALSVPLLARGRSLGVLSVLATDIALYTEEDMELLHTFASQAALAIDTAELYSREHSVASVLQGSILPERLPEFDEVDSSSVYLPAGAEAEIGGDYYDLFRFPDGSLILAIGDVCGKGVVAATKTSMIKYAVRGLAAAGLGPARILTEVNRMVNESGAPSDIVTLWVGLLDVERGILTYANGGHPSAQLYRPETREIDRLAPTGPLLGAVNVARFEEQRTTVQPGDIVLLFTDGVTEARRGNKFFGEGRVRRGLSYGGHAADVTKRLLSALGRFVPGQLRDDAAVLVVRIRTTEERESAKRAAG